MNHDQTAGFQGVNGFLDDIPALFGTLSVQYLGKPSDVVASLYVIFEIVAISKVDSVVNPESGDNPFSEWACGGQVINSGSQCRVVQTKMDCDSSSTIALYL